LAVWRTCRERASKPRLAQARNLPLAEVYLTVEAEARSRLGLG
jgi:hypothetical protein